MAGALAERVFAEKLAGVGFTDVEVVERQPFGLDDAARYPLFTPDLIDVARRLIPDDQQGELATAVTVRARKPA